jgi:hypothetical protein
MDNIFSFQLPEDLTKKTNSCAIVRPTKKSIPQECETEKE